MKQRSKALSQDGLYLLGLDLHWLTERQLRALLWEFNDAFPQAWAFLPPMGADQLLLAGWKSDPKIEWDRFVRVLQKGSDKLTPLEIRSPLDLADRALCSQEGIAALKDKDGIWSRVWQHAIRHQKHPLLPLFKEQVSPEGLFAGNEDLTGVLSERGKSSAAFLDLLEKNAQGNLEQVFQTSRELSATTSGARSLDPLIAPYLAGAKAAIERAQVQGGLTTAWESARTNLSAALLLNPKSAEAHALMGEVHLAEGRLSPATSSFRTALDLQPGLRDPLLGLGRIALRRNDLPSAEKHLREAQTAHPRDWLCAYDLGAFLIDRGLQDEAESYLRKAVALADGEQAAPHAALAQLYLSRGDATAALLEAHRAIRIEKSALNAYILGKAYFEAEQTKSAEQYFQRAILADPNFWQARAGMGLIFAEEGQWKRCVDAFERVLTINMGNQAAQQNLAHCQAQLTTSTPAP